MVFDVLENVFIKIHGSRGSIRVVLLVCHAVDLKDQVVGAQTKLDILTEAVGVLLFNELKDFSLEGMEPHPVTTEQAVFSTGSFSKNIAVAVRKRH